MINMIKKLSSDLKNLGYPDASSMVDLVKEDFEEQYAEEIEEFGSDPVSEKEYLDSTLIVEPDKSGSPYVFEIMEKYNFVPNTITGLDGSEIGQGYFGSVYSGVYKGKDAVIKIEFGPSKEVENWGRLLSVAKSDSEMSRSFSKFIPIVYLLDKSKIENKEYSIIIMERLYPSDKNLNSLLGYCKQYNILNAPYSIFQSFEEWSRVSDNIYYKLITLDYNMYLRYDNVLKSPEHFKILFPGNAPKDRSAKEYVLKAMARSILNLALQDGYMYYEVMRDNKEEYKVFVKHLEEDIYDDLRSASNHIIHYLYHIPSSEAHYNNIESIPNGYIESPSKKYWREDPNLGDLYKFLEYLSDKHNISFADLHTMNIMQNSSGQLKIIDLGLWS